MQKLLEAEPTLRIHFENYIMCRSTQLMVFRRPPKDKRSGEALGAVVWPVGYKFPREGGLDKQSYLEMRLFSAALAGEQEAATEQLKRR